MELFRVLISQFILMHGLWANFYGRTIHEYSKYGFKKVYGQDGTLERTANKYEDEMMKK